VESLTLANLSHRPATTVAVLAAGEAARLLKRSGYTAPQNRPLMEYLYKDQEQVAVYLAKSTKATILMTGPTPMVADPGGEIALLPSLPADRLLPFVDPLLIILSTLLPFTPARPFVAGACTLWGIKRLTERVTNPHQALPELPSVFAALENEATR
jgi:hypothetical protein